jgi:hypothetical protein
LSHRGAKERRLDGGDHLILRCRSGASGQSLAPRVSERAVARDGRSQIHRPRGEPQQLPTRSRGQRIHCTDFRSNETCGNGVVDHAAGEQCDDDAGCCSACRGSDECNAAEPAADGCRVGDGGRSPASALALALALALLGRRLAKSSSRRARTPG